jgi:ABC-type glycerol-3-phosphate transport system permease component
VAWTLLLLGGIVMVMPFAYMLSGSFKLNNEIYELSSCRTSRRSTTIAGCSRSRDSSAGSATRS